MVATTIALTGCSGILRGPLHARAAAQADVATRFTYPIGRTDQPLGDGFLIRHGYATENAWYLPGYWHTGEDWYLADGETAGAPVFAIGAGEVVFAGSEYPGLVVVVRHAAGLFSMYGHLNADLAVATGDSVERGQLIGTVLPRTDGRAPSHLHFEVRTFLTTTVVNGDAPRYSFACGFGCVPGPGYWPIDDPDHPSRIGWRNPTHVIAGATFADGAGPGEIDVVVTSTAAEDTTLWSAPEGDAAARDLGRLPLAAGERFGLLDVATGASADEGTSADAYRLWYRLRLADGSSAWVQGAVPSDADAGTDGRPSSVRFDFVPAIVGG